MTPLFLVVMSEGDASEDESGVEDIFKRLVSIPSLLCCPRFELELILSHQDELRAYRQGQAYRRHGWAVGKAVCCWLAGGAEVRGRLAEVSSERLTLDQGGERVEVLRAEITKARLDATVPWPRA